MKESDIYVNGQIGGSVKKMVARFYWDCVLDRQASEKAGKKVYIDKPHVLLCSDNGKKQIPKLANEKLINTYAREYKHFMSVKPPVPLVAIHLKPSQIKELESYGIRCVDDFENIDCPAGYERYAKCAQAINSLKVQNEKEQNTEIRSIGNHQKRQETVRSEGIQQVKNISGGSSKAKENDQKENSQTITVFEFEYAL